MAEKVIVSETTDKELKGHKYVFYRDSEPHEMVGVIIAPDAKRPGKFNVVGELDCQEVFPEGKVKPGEKYVEVVAWSGNWIVPREISPVSVEDYKKKDIMLSIVRELELIQAKAQAKVVISASGKTNIAVNPSISGTNATLPSIRQPNEKSKK